MSEVEELRKKLTEVETELSTLKAAAPTVGRDYSKQKYTPKNPLGMKDYLPHEMVSR